ncbi:MULTISPECIES: DUF3800 domain-containing protein [unclassified Imperialibacter]|uniref:DUF3800 domain-containing protein n=1 Tax=unclassified Imperialibacter TaxID=2629706 RepID=UPI00125400F3|nr:MULTISPECIES: DUF3800 domain-containing protein [unclassified Imperialibacter]CAD5257278.1 conserved hypothetical protein [Imperialibacter sp. 89]CAD5272281.1 conserved hypothetical protein [Imperialibacter sp. 75]VVT32076.1 conserved hypothetical protein [Imperialibacter sp. EC-SDR9]
MKEKGFYIFCDESLKQGKYYSNFYGGCMIARADFERVNNVLLSKRMDLNMEDSELKWGNINSQRIEAYCEMMEVFFQAVANNLIKVRVMFTDNRFVPTSIPHDNRRIQYHLLYYQFIKHSFGFPYLESDYPIQLELFFDTLPDSHTKNKKFKDFIYGIQFLPELASANLRLSKSDIYEVDSKKHIILQCIDVVIGAMAFRLNDQHKEKPAGQKRRGKRTLAKEKVYKYINTRIREIRPHFNIGISTGIDNDKLDRFLHPYRHWLFTPSDYVYQKSSKKEKRPNKL